jgi:hypothetical protein
MSTISTIVPTTTSVPPPHETCRLHIREASLNSDQPLIVELNVTAGDNGRNIGATVQINWGDTAGVLKDETLLPYDVIAVFSQFSSDSNVEDWPIKLKAGSTQWTSQQTDSSQLPYCSVGGWDNSHSQNYNNTDFESANGLPVSFF